jgi:hypothetical protein
MGLLDTWQEWKKSKQGNSFGEDFSGMNSDIQSPTLNTAGGITNPSYNRNESPLVKNPIFTKENFKKAGNTIYDSLPGSDFDRKFAVKEAEKTQGTPAGSTIPFNPSQGGDINSHGGNQQDQLNWWQKLAKKAGIKDFDKAAANWKEKGGFDGLMSNPAFSLGLALMQSSANGKTINQGILDNFIKAGGISAEYQDRIEARKEEPIQATAADMAETKNLLSKVGVSEGNWFENFGSRVANIFGKGGSKNPGLDYDKAVEEISLQYQIAIKDKQTALKKAGKSQVIRIDDKIKIMDDLVKSGKIQKNTSFFSRFGITDATIQKKAQGGPVSQGQPYLVGEKGPEIIIPRSDGDVLTNDDSQIYAMLLASNPQLQKVSKTRAEKIMRNRFPEYFEG